MAALELSSTPLYSDAALTHYWKLENLNATIGGVTLSNPTGKSFAAALFNNGIDMGSTTRNTLELNSSTVVVPTSVSAAYTVSLWFKQNTAISAGNQDPGLLTCSNANATGYAFAIIPIWNGGSPQIQVKRRTASDANDTVSFANDTTNWHNIIHTYNGTNIVNYLDGVAFSAGVASSSSFNSSVYPKISIGGSFFSNNAMSIIDDVWIMTRAITAAEALSVYDGNFGGTFTPRTTWFM